MPANPSPAQQQASRENGARSHGPTSAEGRARIAAAATRHGLTGSFRLLPEEDAAAFEALLEGWRARLQPEGEPEAAAVAKIVAAIWREQRLFGFEERLLRALARGEPVDGLPSLATVIRYRARLERDRRLAEEELLELRRLRRTLPAEPAAAADVPSPGVAEQGAGVEQGTVAVGAMRSEATGRAAEEGAAVPAFAGEAAGAAAGAARVTAPVRPSLAAAGGAAAPPGALAPNAPGADLDPELVRVLREAVCELARPGPLAATGAMFAPRAPQGGAAAAVRAGVTRAA